MDFDLRGLLRLPQAAAIRRRKGRRPYSFQSFMLTVATIFLLCTWSFVSSRVFGIHHGPSDSTFDDFSVLRWSATTLKQLECRDIIYAYDKCGFVQANCVDENSGLIPYLTLYYCASPFLEPFSFILLVCWLALLFTTIGIAASDFFSVNLSTISSFLGLSQSLAGVTFLAFGNGSPDVFSTFAAMGSGSASMAVGELIGAASFITAVVAGSMALVTEFRVARKSFVRDICFFIVAIIFTTYFLFDGKLLYWECWAMIGYYAVYVFTVVTCHWYDKRKAAARLLLRRLDKPQGAAIEPYSDNVYNNRSGSSSVMVVSPLLGPSTPVDPSTPLLEAGIHRRRTSGEDDEEDDELESLVAAEISNNMRVIRTPGHRRRNTTVTPIRPSLMGALEFRSDLERAKKEMDPLPLLQLPATHSRRPQAHHRCWSATDLEDMFNKPPSQIRSYSPSLLVRTPLTSPLAGPSSRSASHTGTRERALSSGDRPNSNDLPVHIPPPVSLSSTDDMRQMLLNKIISRQSSPERPNMHSRSGSTTSFHSYKIAGNLAPPPTFPQSPNLAPPPATGLSGSLRKNLTSSLPKLHIPSPLAQSAAPSDVSIGSPFPAFSLSPGGMSLGTAGSPTITERDEDGVERPLLQPALSHPIPTFNIEAADERNETLNDKSPLNQSWWPACLPSPRVLSCTLFPTMQNWKDKGHWDRFVSIMTVPSVLLLVLTLPVVDGEGLDSDTETIYSMPATPQPSIPTSLRPTTSNIPEVLASPTIINPPNEENEWQQYRRYSKTHHRQISSVASQQVSPPILIAFEPPTAFPTASAIDTTPRTPAPHLDAAVDTDALSIKCHEIQEETDLSWSRWLVGLQIFTGPAFFLCVLWANMLDELDDPTWQLEQFLGIGLVFSAVVFIVFIITTEYDKKPKHHSLLCFLGFLVSIAWISTIAGEVVGVLKAIGVIMDISEALLGLTVFAAGNSLGDLVADITVARLGYPVMALAACFGGPMLNILLGIGLGGVMMMYRKAHHHHQHHPNLPIKYKPFKVEVGGALLISALSLLVTLIALLVLVPANKWVLSRKIGWGLIIFWGIVTLVNVLLDLCGYLR